MKLPLRSLIGIMIPGFLNFFFIFSIIELMVSSTVVSITIDDSAPLLKIFWILLSFISRKRISNCYYLKKNWFWYFYHSNKNSKSFSSNGNLFQMHGQTYRQHARIARTHTYTYTHITFHQNYIILIYLICSMYLTGVWNYLMKYLVYNNCNKIPMGHIAHLRKIFNYFQYNFPYYWISLWKRAWITWILFTQNTVCQVWLKFVQWFWRKS